MAAQLLLLLLCSSVQTQDLGRVGGFHRFLLDRAADFCSVSKWTTEGREQLWNDSGSHYDLDPLTLSHSGQYRERCWTRGNATRDRNSTLLVCDDQKMRGQGFHLNVGETVELSCEGVGPNQSVQWAYDSYEREDFTVIDQETSPQHLQLVSNQTSLRLTVDRRFLRYFYYCLVKQPLRCHLLTRFYLDVSPEFILRREGESVTLNCSDGSRNQSHVWKMKNSLGSETESFNSTLTFPSLTLLHSGHYTCDLGAAGPLHHHLLVCPEPEPPAVRLFTEGENLTLHCGARGQVHWFLSSNRTGARLLNLQYQRLARVRVSGSSLVLRNVSLQDSGRLSCLVERSLHCLLRSETLLVFGEPQVDPRLPRSLVVGAAVLVMLCVVGVVGGVVWRGRRREELPAAVEELEMSQLSPESDAQEEAPGAAMTLESGGEGTE